MNGLLLAHYYHDGHGWFPFPFIPLIFFPFWIFVIVLFARRWRRGLNGPSGEAVLAERYARGEIDEAEFISRRQVLRRKD